MSLTLLLTGDSMVTRRNPVPPCAATSGLRELIAGADVAFTNLEVVPIDFRGYPRGDIRGNYLNAPSGVVDDLVELGFDLFSCANNHSLNFGTEGVSILIELLRRKGVVFSGIGMNLAEARIPAYVDGPNGSVALIAATSTFRPGEQAGPQKSDFQGRPGVNPVTVMTTHELSDEHFAALKEISEALGIEGRVRMTIARGMRNAADGSTEDQMTFLEGKFVRSDATRIRTNARARDVQEMSAAVREARRRADVVVVSVHSHESGASEADPADFLIAFAHTMVDEGADVVVCHGPHRLRGMEIYDGKPIFYSLGNFIAQNEYVPRQPAEAYDHVGMDYTATAADLSDKRNDNGKRGFQAHRRYWESVAPLCEFEGGRVTAIRIYPLALGFGAAAPLRGRPVLATGAEAESILATFADLSHGFGVSFDVEDGIATVRLQEPAVAIS